MLAIIVMSIIKFPPQGNYCFVLGNCIVIRRPGNQTHSVPPSHYNSLLGLTFDTRYTKNLDSINSLSQRFSASMEFPLVSSMETPGFLQDWELAISGYQQWLVPWCVCVVMEWGEVVGRQGYEWGFADFFRR